MATLNGVTFEERTVRSLDDARINTALFSDGILTGCALTYSGANLTIAKGALMVKGREIAVDNNETIASTPTYTNGYGRLKYVINLGAAASSSTFTQGATAWQYASTNSFAALTQQDINDGTSTTYEIEICRVKYTSGSITSIVSQLAAALHDYVYWQGDVTASDSSVWYVRKWRSGFTEATHRMQRTNPDPLTYSTLSGVYYTDPPIASEGIKFPFTLPAFGARVRCSPVAFRMGLTFQNVSYNADGILGVRLWSPTTLPFAGVGTLFVDMVIHIEGVPA